MHYLLFYEVADDYMSRRAQFREEHLNKAWKASERGELVLGGALTNPADGAVLLFKGESSEVAEQFARTDPYVLNGLVKRWHVREWNTVAGEQAATPARPAASSPKTPLILRMWKALSNEAKTPAYISHMSNIVVRRLRTIEGFRGEFLLRRRAGDIVEIVVLTLWDSMDAVRKFAGPEPERAVVEEEARAVLTEFDESVTHFEVVDRVIL